MSVKERCESDGDLLSDVVFDAQPGHVRLLCGELEDDILISFEKAHLSGHRPELMKVIDPERTGATVTFTIDSPTAMYLARLINDNVPKHIEVCRGSA